MVREGSISGCGCDDEALLAVRVSRDGDARAEVRLLGELDLYTAPRVTSTLHSLLAAGHEAVVVDLSGLGFLGARGLEVFAEAGARYDAAGTRLVLIGLTDRMRRLFRVTGLDAALTIE